MHNINHLLNESSDSTVLSGRQRTDSYTSTTSNATLSSYGPNNEYRETKSSELRKKTTLMNKIITKTQQFDPIYSRSHPISTELNTGDQGINSVVNTSIGSYEQASAARKRLFAKKNEKNTMFDPNMSICSTSSSSSGTTNSSVPTSSSVSFNVANQRQSRAAKPVNYIKNNIDNVQNYKRNSPTKQPCRSKSSNDLYYKPERTNSEQDLIELLNNCDAPIGDLNQYKIMLTETQKLEQHIASNKTKTKKLKSRSNTPTLAKQQPPPLKQLNNTDQLQADIDFCEQEANSNEANSETEQQRQHKRTRSMPHYAIPDIQINSIEDSSDR